MTVERSVYEAMLKAARRAAPLEACGLLGGRDGRATQFHEMTNAEASGEHYSMVPGEQFAAVKAMRAAGLKMLAIWHSHPASPARMSEEDLRLAHTPEVVYLILSLADPDAPDLRGYAVENGRAAPVAIVLPTPASPSPTASHEGEPT